MPPSHPSAGMAHCWRSRMHWAASSRRRCGEGPLARRTAHHAAGARLCPAPANRTRCTRHTRARRTAAQSKRGHHHRMGNAATRDSIGSDEFRRGVSQCERPEARGVDGGLQLRPAPAAASRRHGLPPPRPLAARAAERDQLCHPARLPAPRSHGVGADRAQVHLQCEGCGSQNTAGLPARTGPAQAEPADYNGPRRPGHVWAARTSPSRCRRRALVAQRPGAVCGVPSHDEQARLRRPPSSRRARPTCLPRPLSSPLGSRQAARCASRARRGPGVGNPPGGETHWHLLGRTATLSRAAPQCPVSAGAV